MYSLSLLGKSLVSWNLIGRIDCQYEDLYYLMISSMVYLVLVSLVFSISETQALALGVSSYILLT